MTMIATMTAFDLCKVEGHPGRSRNPRHSHLCERCGRPYEEPSMERDLAKEREWTREAASMAQYVPEPELLADVFSSYRESRTGSGPWLGNRDWITEGIEECADLSAYMMAALQELELEDRDDEDALKAWMLLRIALAASCTAFGALSQYRTVDL